MSRADVLIEFKTSSINFEQCTEAMHCKSTNETLIKELSIDMAKMGFEASSVLPVMPMFSDAIKHEAFSSNSPALAKHLPRKGTMVVAASLDKDKVETVRRKTNVADVWPCSKMVLLNDYSANSPSGSVPPTPFGSVEPMPFGSVPPMPFGSVGPMPFGSVPPMPFGSVGPMPFGSVPPMPFGSVGPMPFGTPGPHSAYNPIDMALTGGNSTDCRPFRHGVSIDVIRNLLGVERIWFEGFRGQNIVVGILDEGVNGDVYPVIGGFNRPNAQRPGSASITSHGSMCAAGILVAAPQARILDYPFLGVPNSGGAIAMLQAVLNQRALDGTPHLTTNSYGFTGVPGDPRHEVNNPNHPVHRKVKEVVQSGAPCFFAAGNCGEPCPSGDCQPSGIGAGKSIHASNALEEVITVAAVNSQHERIGYSSQGPGHANFENCKPDIAAYSHYFGNFGPGRPGGLSQPFDNGTSAACPLAAGVGALLLSVYPQLTPEQLKGAMVDTATDIGKVGFDFQTGRGVINAAAAFHKVHWTDDFKTLTFVSHGC